GRRVGHTLDANVAADQRASDMSHRPENNEPSMTARGVLGVKTVATTVAAIAAMLANGLVAAADLQGAEAIALRQANFKEIGAAFKTLRDEIRSRHPDTNAIGSAARDLTRRAGVVATLFPADSAPAVGVETRAKAEIWRDEAGFKASMEQFVSRSTTLFMAVRAN